jgi:hypothetical protein
LVRHEQLRRFTSRNTFTRNSVIITRLFSVKLVSLHYVSCIEQQNIGYSFSLYQSSPGSKEG